MGAATSAEGEPTAHDLSTPMNWRSRIAGMDDDELVRQPAPESFQFALEDNLSAAREVLQDERVALLRYRLVPSQMDEAQFWRALFYRLSQPDIVRRTSEPEEVLLHSHAASPAVVVRRVGAEPEAATPGCKEDIVLDDSYFTPHGTARDSYQSFGGHK